MTYFLVERRQKRLTYIIVMFLFVNYSALRTMDSLLNQNVRSQNTFIWRFKGI